MICTIKGTRNQQFFLKIQSLKQKMRRRVEEAEIVIIGGGICGLATALALHRKGITSLVLERSEELRATGAAIIVQANGWRALDQLGVASPLRQAAVQIHRGKVVLLGEAEPKEIPFEINQEFRCLKRTDLIKAMANCLPVGTIRTSCQVLSIQLDPLSHQYPQLMLSNGITLQAKVVIGCDGVNSMVANMVGLRPMRLLLFSTCVARGFTNYPNGHQFPAKFVVISRDHVQLGRIPVSHNLVYWFLTRLRTNQDSIISKDPVLIRESLMESMVGFPEDTMEMIRQSMLDSLHLTELKYRPPWDLVINKFRRGTVTVAGDAMHATGPFIAQGGSASLEDAVVLARCLSKKLLQHNNTDERERKRKIEEALDEYVRERRMRIVWLSLHTFLIGKKLDVHSLMLKLIIVAIIGVLFRDPDGHIHYDCGTL